MLNLYARGKADAADPEYVDKHQNHLGGHGTHVCGSVLGDGLSPILGGKIQGTAPQAKLVMQALADANGDLQTGPDLKVIFAQPYDNDGARIHTNSWGIEFRGTQRQYTTNNDHSAEDIDTFVWNHKDMTLRFSAGNDGQDPGAKGIVDGRQIGSGAIAKNCITVAASESLRPNDTQTYAVFDNRSHKKFPANPIKDDLIANNIEGMADFSSRGPSFDGRIKPDITAPGTDILSTRARGLSNLIDSAQGDSNWAFMSGTSNGNTAGGRLRRRASRDAR